MPLLRISSILVFLLIWTVQTAHATHLRAGQITAVRDATRPSEYAYIFTLTLYRDTQGVPQDQAEIVIGPVDNSEVDARITSPANSPRRLVGTNIEEITYTFNYTFSGQGEFKISFTEEFRNEGVVNMTNSVNTPFYLETIIFANPTLGINNTPVLLNPPVNGAEVGQKFCHNPAAFDPDGDSLSYRLIVPRQNPTTSVANYRSPETVGLPLGIPESPITGAPTFTLNPLTGEICWNAPGAFGIASQGFAEYNIAFEVLEWRKTGSGRYVQIGTLVQDMQITVRDQPNKRPNLIIPNDTCIVAGTTALPHLFKATIRATDPDLNQRLRISSESAIFSKITSIFPNQPAATLNPPNTPPTLPENYGFQSNPATSSFEWNVNCGHVRSQPYDVVFKAEDNVTPPNRLADIKTWRITVVGPAPTGLSASVEGKAIRLNWQPYPCSNLSQIKIWRRIGCSPDKIDPCVTNNPAGYELVGTVAANTTTFLDTKVLSGVLYSYRISGVFVPRAAGTSAFSSAVCIRLKFDIPLITKVSVEKTSRSSGKIRVRWAQPPEIEQTSTPPPYEYRVFRATGFTRNFGASPVFTTTRATNIPTDYVEFVDSTGLNTEDNPYTYVVLLYRNGILLDSSRTASSVRLSTRPLPNAIELSWQAQVPWDNTNTTHKVFRKRPLSETFEELTPAVSVTSPASFRFTDTGNGLVLNSDSVYCYRIETQGTYNVPIIETPLFNFSQETCASPLDTIKPCAVILSIDPTKCEQWVLEQGKEGEGEKAQNPSFCSLSSFDNHLTWIYPTQQGPKICKERDVFKYRIYYKRYEEDEQFTLIDSVLSPTPPDKEYFHKNLPSYAGCYYVTAVDRSNNESLPSNVVCQDNCPYYVLPNIITPDNGDMLNQVFKPFPCPRFIESGKITIINRWGRMVYQTTDIAINWPGRLNSNAELSSKQDLSPGVYYYLAELKTTRLRRKDEKMILKGWVQILR